MASLGLTSSIERKSPLSLCLGFLEIHVSYKALPAPPASPLPHGPPTCLAGDDHGLHGQLEELVQHQVQEEHQGLQAGGVQADEAEFQLVLQGCLTDLLVQHADGEGHLAFQGVAEGEELLQVVVLGRQTAGLMQLPPSTLTSGCVSPERALHVRSLVSGVPDLKL